MGELWHIYRPGSYSTLTPETQAHSSENGIQVSPHDRVIRQRRHERRSPRIHQPPHFERGAIIIPRNPKLIDPNDSSTGVGILFILVFLAALSWMGSRDRDDEQRIRCPHPGPGQYLIRRGHMEADGEPGELLCTYSTAPNDRRADTVASTRL